MDAESRHTMELAKCRSELDSKCDELRKLVTAHQEVVQDFEIRTKSMKESHNAEIDILIAQSKQALASQNRSRRAAHEKMVVNHDLCITALVDKNAAAVKEHEAQIAQHCQQVELLQTNHEELTLSLTEHLTQVSKLRAALNDYDCAFAESNVVHSEEIAALNTKHNAMIEEQESEHREARIELESSHKCVVLNLESTLSEVKKSQAKDVVDLQQEILTRAEDERTQEGDVLM